MKHAKHDIEIRQGSDFSLTFTWYVGDPVPGNEVDLTGYTARLQVRYSLDSATTVASVTTTPGAGGSITLGGALGTIEVEIPASVTSLITKSGVYDLELVTGAGLVERSIGGRAKLIREVTR